MVLRHSIVAAAAGLVLAFAVLVSKLLDNSADS